MKKRKIALIVSLILNLLLVVVLLNIMQNRGGMYYVRAKINNHLPGHEKQVNVYQEIKKNLFNPKNTEHVDYVFAGDSQIDYNEWSELFPGLSIANRGLAGDTSTDLFGRIEQIVKLKPKKVFIMIGINDIQRQIPLKTTIDNYENIVGALKKGVPNVDIVVHAVLHVENEHFQMYLYQNASKINQKVSKLNKELETFTNKNSLTFIDMNSDLTENGQLRSDLTIDGLHLNSEGYAIWKSRIIDIVK